MAYTIEPHQDVRLAHTFETREFLRGAGEVGRRFRAEPHGNFRALDGRGRAVGVGSCIVHGPTEGPPELAWIGGLFVRPTHRGKGLGRRLLDACLAHARERRARVLGLDAMPELVGLYEEYGFRVVTECARWTLTGAPKVPSSTPHALYPISSCEWRELVAYDESRFGAVRARWLAELLSDLPERAFVTMRRDGSLSGFAVGQEEFIGPVVAEDADAAALLLHGCVAAGSPARVHVLESDGSVTNALKRLGWSPEPHRCVRMTTSGRLPGDPATQFAIGAWAVG